MTVLVVQNSPLDPPGPLAGWLGVPVTVHRAYADGPPPTTLPAEHDGLVVLGGGMSVRDTDRHPFLAAELALLRETVARGVPTLGICLGAQLLATALGGRVDRARAGPEVGAAWVQLTDRAYADPLLTDLPHVVPVVQWHWDEVVALPPGATHLAASPACPHQVFRVAERAWGLQFHPEATPDVVAAWAEQDAAVVRAAGLDPDAAAAAANRTWPDVSTVWGPVVGRFGHLVAGGPSSGGETLQELPSGEFT